MCTLHPRIRTGILSAQTLELDCSNDALSSRIENIYELYRAQNRVISKMSAAVEEVRDHVNRLLELQNARPVEARRIFRQGHYFKEGTGGLCRGRKFRIESVILLHVHTLVLFYNVHSE